MVLEVINYITDKENVCISPKVGYKRKPLEYQEKASPFTPKRRLMFVEKVFQGEIFYIDPKTLHSTSVGDIERKLTLLGGRVEKFMCKDVTCVISDRRESTKVGNSASVNSPSGNGHRFSTMSPMGGSTFSPTPMSRGQALLMKSNLKNSSNKSSKGCSDVLSTAKQLGIKVLDLKDILKQINREVLKCDPNAKWSPTQLSKAKKQSSSKKVKPMKGNYIKFEHESSSYKPVYGKITSFPVVEVSQDFEGCPFDPEPRKEPKPVPKSCQKSKTNVKPIVLQQNRNQSKLKKVKKDKKPKSGYCESCESYFSDLRQHLISKSHLDFIANKENFKSLDNYLTSLPSVPDLMSSFTNVSVPNNDNNSSSIDDRCYEVHNELDELQPAETKCVENDSIVTNFCVITKQLPVENNNLKVLPKESNICDSLPNELCQFNKGAATFVSTQNNGLLAQSCTENVTKSNSAVGEPGIMSLDFEIGNLEFNLFSAGSNVNTDFQNYSNLQNTVSQNVISHSKDSSAVFTDMRNVDFDFAQSQTPVLNAHVSSEKSVLNEMVGQPLIYSKASVPIQYSQTQGSCDIVTQAVSNPQDPDSVLPQSINHTLALANDDTSSNKPLTFKDFSYSDIQNLDIMKQGDGSHHNISSLLDNWNPNEQLGSKLGSKINSIIENIVCDNVYKSSSDRYLDKQPGNNCGKSSNDIISKSGNSFLDVLKNSMHTDSQKNLNTFTNQQENSTFTSFANIASTQNHQMSVHENGTFLCDNNLFAQGISDFIMLNKADGNQVKHSNTFLEANFSNARKFSEISEISDPNMKPTERVFGSNIPLSNEKLVCNSQDMSTVPMTKHFGSSFQSGDSLTVHKTMDHNGPPHLSTSGPPVLSIFEPIASSHVEYSEPPELTFCKSGSKSACDMKSNSLSKLTEVDNKTVIAPCLTEMEPCSDNESSSSSDASSSDTLCTSSESGSSSSSSNSGSEPGAMLSQLIPSKPVFRKATTASQSLLMSAVTNSFKLLTPRRRKKREGSKLGTSEMSIKEDENQQSELCQGMGDCSLYREVETGLDILKQLCDGFIVEQEEESEDNPPFQIKPSNINIEEKSDSKDVIDNTITVEQEDLSESFQIKPSDLSIEEESDSKDLIDNTITEDMNETLTCDQTVEKEEQQELNFISENLNKKQVASPAIMYDEKQVASPSVMYDEKQVASPAVMYDEKQVASPAVMYDDKQVTSPAVMYNEKQVASPAVMYNEKQVASPAVMYDDISSCDGSKVKSSDKNDYSFISENDSDWNYNLKSTCNNIVDRLDNDDSQQNCYINTNGECTDIQENPTLRFDSNVYKSTIAVTENSTYSNLKSLELLEHQTKILEQQTKEALSYNVTNNKTFQNPEQDFHGEIETVGSSVINHTRSSVNVQNKGSISKNGSAVLDSNRCYQGYKNEFSSNHVTHENIEPNVVNNESLKQMPLEQNVCHSIINNNDNTYEEISESSTKEDRHHGNENVPSVCHSIINNNDNAYEEISESSTKEDRQHGNENVTTYNFLRKNKDSLNELNNSESCVLNLAVKKNRPDISVVSSSAEVISKQTKQSKKQIFVGSNNSPLDLSVKPRIAKSTNVLEVTPPSKKCLPFKKRMITFQTSKTYSEISQGSITAVAFDESSISADPALLRKSDENTETEPSKLLDSNAIFSAENVFRKEQEFNSDSRLVPLVDDSTCDSAIIDVCGISDSESAPIKTNASNLNSAATEDIGFHKYFSKEQQKRKKESVDGNHDDTSRSSLSRANSFESSCSLKSASSGYHSELPNQTLRSHAEIPQKRKRGRPRKNPDVVVPAKKKAKVESPLLCYDASIENSLPKDGFAQPLRDITSSDNIANGKRKKTTKKRKIQTVSDNGSTVCEKSIRDMLNNHDNFLDVNKPAEKSTICGNSLNDMLGNNEEHFQQNNRISSAVCDKTFDPLVTDQTFLPKPKKIRTNSSESVTKGPEKWKAESLGGLKLKVFKLGSLNKSNTPADSLTTEVPNKTKISNNNKRKQLENDNLYISEDRSDIYNVKPKKKKQRKKEVMQFFK